MTASCEKKAISGEMPSRKNGFLDDDQCLRLHKVLDMVVSVDSQYGYASIRFTLREYLKALRRQLLANDTLSHCQLKLNGGAAAYVVHSSSSPSSSSSVGDDGGGGGGASSDSTDGSSFFNDFDIVIDDSTADKLTNASDGRWERVREAIFDCITEVAAGAQKERACYEERTGQQQSQIPPDHLLRSIVWDAYVSSTIRVWTQNDHWALICFSNKRGQNLEVKYTQRMKRQYQFSVDSFHINLDDHTLSSESNSGERSYPVVVESVYGNYEEALLHLRNKLIVTKRPEEIRGGGLLRYCQLLVNGYTPVSSTQRSEPYMCVRFLIDYPTIDKQQRRLMDYISRHFISHTLQTHQLTSLPPICDWLCRLKSIMANVQGTSQYTLNLIAEMAQAACYAATTTAVVTNSTTAAAAAAAALANVRYISDGISFHRHNVAYISNSQRFGPSFHPPPPPPPPPLSATAAAAAFASYTSGITNDNHHNQSYLNKQPRSYNSNTTNHQQQHSSSRHRVPFGSAT
ncbi:hypothetical protein ACOME3_009450 [Neoechinorhynchus agilis]